MGAPELAGLDWAELDWAGIAAIAARAAGCGLFVWGVLRSAASAPPALAAVIIAQPLAMASGFFALAAHESDAFVAEAAGRAAASVPAIVIFITTCACLYARLPRGPLIGAGLLAWGASALVMTALPGGLAVAVGLFALTLALTHLVWPLDLRLALVRGAAGRRRYWPAGVQGGAVVIVLSLFSSLLGPRLSAVLSALPVAFIFLTLALKHAEGADWRATYQSARIGMSCLLIYACAIHALTPLVGGLAACAAALVPSLALSLITTHLRLRLSARTPARMAP